MDVSVAFLLILFLLLSNNFLLHPCTKLTPFHPSRPTEEYIAPAEHPYQYIIFRASEVKDIALDREELPIRPRTVHDDPAVLGVSVQLLYLLR